ncbi:MAG TPA: hypothetical protein ENH97_01935 [bacterium]|nr:hypothetical protein [bacterium]
MIEAPTSVLNAKSERIKKWRKRSFI